MNEKTPSEEFNLPVIGRIWARLDLIIDGVSSPSETDEFEVISILERENGTKTYVCNSWNSPGRPQLVADICVIRFEEK